MSLHLIDDQGEIWRGDSRRLRAAFDSPRSGGAFVDYAVKHLGFIAVETSGTSCRVRLRPGLVSDRTAKTLHDWVLNAGCERIVVSLFEGDWQSELLRTANLPQRLDALLAERRSAPRDDFLSAPLHYSTLAGHPLLYDIVTAWPHVARHYRPEALIGLLKGIFDNRFVVVKLPVEAERPVFQELGEALLYSAYDTWRTCAIGAPIEEQPDRHFGKWVTSVYEAAATDEHPRLEAVDAIIRWPHAGRSRHRYQRLILPFPTDAAPRLLLGGTIVDDTIDLRVAPS